MQEREEIDEGQYAISHPNPNPDPEVVAAAELVPKKGGRRPNFKLNAYKLQLVERLFRGEYDGSRNGYLRNCGFSDREKAYIMRDPRFLEIIDALMFDVAFGLAEIPKERIRLIELMTRKLWGAVKPGMTVNVKKASIRVK